MYAVLSKETAICAKKFYPELYKLRQRKDIKYIE